MWCPRNFCPRRLAVSPPITGRVPTLARLLNQREPTPKQLGLRLVHIVELRLIAGVVI